MEPSIIVWRAHSLIFNYALWHRNCNSWDCSPCSFVFFPLSFSFHFCNTCKCDSRAPLRTVTFCRFKIPAEGLLDWNSYVLPVPAWLFLIFSSVWPVTPCLVRALQIARCLLISTKKFPQLSIWISPSAQSKRRAEETHQHTCANVHNVHRQLHMAVTNSQAWIDSKCLDVCSSLCIFERLAVSYCFLPPPFLSSSWGVQ